MLLAAEVADSEEILKLQKLAYQSEAERYQTFDIPPLTQTLDSLRDDIKKKIVLKIVRDDRLVGSVRGYVKDGTGYIGRLIVHPDYWNQGLGQSMMREIEQKLMPVKRYELFTGHQSLRTISIYRKLGYRVFREHVINDRLSEVFMEKVVG